jgi:primosomal protein N' (replication factor Y)
VPSPERPAPEPDSLRDLADVLDDEPYLPEAVLRLCLWVAEYYACSPGEVIAAAMPPMAMVESRRIVELTEQGQEAVSRGDDAGISPMQRDALRMLGAARRMPVSTLRARLAKATPQPRAVPIAALLRALERLGFVIVAQVLEGERAAYRTERVVRLTAQGIDLAARLDDPGLAERLGARQRDLLRALKAAPAGLSTADLRERNLPAEGLRRLELRRLVSVARRPVERNPFAGPWGRGAESGGRDSSALELTGAQRALLDRLRELAAGGQKRVALVHGVTGSGKTEVYLRLAQEAVDEGRDVLVLVPEIALTPAVAAAFRMRFGDRVALQHSGLSDGERHDQWQRIRRGDADIVVGTRSAVFAPLGNVGLIVVDEEHDGAYKQDESPRYNGRDVAIVRGTNAKALVVLGSATPSMESYAHATQGRYALLELERRVLDRPLADVHAVNMRDEYATAGPDIVLSALLLEHIGRRLERREQVLLLLNRRGFSTAVFCRQCGGTVECPNCSVSLVVYGRGAAVCHYCNHSRRVPRTCPSCGAPYLELMGVGDRARRARGLGRIPGGARGADGPRRRAAPRDSRRAPGRLRRRPHRRAGRHADDREGARLPARDARRRHLGRRRPRARRLPRGRADVPIADAGGRPRRARRHAG